MKNNMKFPVPKHKESPIKLDKLRHYQVRTRNSLIQNTSFSLTAKQQKIILHLIQKISDKTKSLKFRFNVHDYERFLGIEPDSRNTKSIKHALQRLANKSFWLRTKDIDSDHPNDEYDDLVRWFSRVRYNRTRGYFEIQFDSRLKPFLLHVKDNFTSIDYHNVIGMRKSYSIRLYQIFVSHYNEQSPHFGYKYSINQLRFQLGIPHGKYKRFADLNRRVLQPSLREMNEKTNFNFYYNSIKDGRKTVGVRIMLHRKSKASQRIVNDKIDRKLLGKPAPDKRTIAKEHRSAKENESKAEQAFKNDVKKFHARRAEKDKIHDRRKFLRNQAARKRRKLKDSKRKQQRYKKYSTRYKK